jgi:UDP-3-O-[3-hydroxymyristoyl] glucosamine N-acyltransferase
MIVSQAGIAGSSKIGNHVTMGGQVGIVGHLTIGDDTMIGAKSGVTVNLPPGSRISGIPAYDHGRWLRSSALIPKLPELKKSVATLEKRIAEIEKLLKSGN